MKNHDKTNSLLSNLLSLKNFKKAQEIISKNPNDVDVLYKEGIYFKFIIKNDNYTCAKQFLKYFEEKQFSKKDFEYQEAKDILGGILKNYSDSDSDLSEEMESVLASYMFTEKELLKKGDKYTKLQKYDKAEAYYNKAIEVDANYKTAYLHLGNMFIKQGQNCEFHYESQEACNFYKKATNQYQKAIFLDKKYAYSHAQLGDAYSKLLNLLEENNSYMNQDNNFYELAYTAYKKAIDNKKEFYLHPNKGLLNLMIIAEKYGDAQEYKNFLMQKKEISTYAYNLIDKTVSKKLQELKDNKDSEESNFSSDNDSEDFDDLFAKENVEEKNTFLYKNIDQENFIDEKSNSTNILDNNINKITKFNQESQIQENQKLEQNLNFEQEQLAQDSIFQNNSNPEI
jgi:hypothetical protein